MARLLVFCLVLGLAGCSADGKPADPAKASGAPKPGEKPAKGPPVM